MTRWAREDVRFPSGNAECGAWLYKPEGSERPPVVVLCHGRGTPTPRRSPLQDSQRCLSPTGTSVTVAGSRASCSTSSSQLADIAAALDCVRKRADLDGSRVALRGTSFGGGHVMVAAAKRGRIRALFSRGDPALMTAADVGSGYRPRCWASI
jgi:dienelactone hydrolase